MYGQFMNNTQKNKHFLLCPKLARGKAPRVPLARFVKIQYNRTENQRHNCARSHRPRALAPSARARTVRARDSMERNNLGFSADRILPCTAKRFSLKRAMFMRHDNSARIQDHKSKKQNHCAILAQHEYDSAERAAARARLCDQIELACGTHTFEGQALETLDKWPAFKQNADMKDMLQLRSDAMRQFEESMSDRLFAALTEYTKMERMTSPNTWNATQEGINFKAMRLAFLGKIPSCAWKHNLYEPQHQLTYDIVQTMQRVCTSGLSEPPPFEELSKKPSMVDSWSSPLCFVHTQGYKSKAARELVADGFLLGNPLVHPMCCLSSMSADCARKNGPLFDVILLVEKLYTFLLRANVNDSGDTGKELMRKINNLRHVLLQERRTIAVLEEDWKYVLESTHMEYRAKDNEINKPTLSMVWDVLRTALWEARDASLDPFTEVYDIAQKVLCGEESTNGTLIVSVKGSHRRKKLVFKPSLDAEFVRVWGQHFLTRPDPSGAASQQPRLPEMSLGDACNTVARYTKEHVCANVFHQMIALAEANETDKKRLVDATMQLVDDRVEIAWWVQTRENGSFSFSNPLDKIVERCSNRASNCSDDPCQLDALCDDLGIAFELGRGFFGHENDGFNATSRAQHDLLALQRFAINGYNDGCGGSATNGVSLLGCVRNVNFCTKARLSGVRDVVHCLDKCKFLNLRDPHSRFRDELAKLLVERDRSGLSHVGSALSDVVAGDWDRFPVADMLRHFPFDPRRVAESDARTAFANMVKRHGVADQLVLQNHWEEWMREHSPGVNTETDTDHAAFVESESESED
jgi:hypothetical protein